MSYKIFISHAGVDTPIAEAVRNSIDKAFGEKIKLFLAQSDISSAVEWKAELRKHLEISDAIICILTPESIHKPWIYIEWSPFWLNNKTSYILHLGDISIDSLVSPMQERQATKITDITKVRSFYKSLAKEANSKTPSNQSIDEFIDVIEKAKFTKLENSFGRFRSKTSKLPAVDEEKREIARFFYDNNEIENFIRVSKKIRNDSIKLDLIFETLDDTKFSKEKELKIVSEIVESFNSADKIGETAIQLIKSGYLDSPVLRNTLENLATLNLAELRKVAIYLIDKDQEDTDLFIFICQNMIRNHAEFRKIIEHLIISDKFQIAYFSDLIRMFTNYVELKKIGIFMIAQKKQKTDQFLELVKFLSEESRHEHEQLMKNLK